jgi:hypothetical protein
MQAKFTRANSETLEFLERQPIVSPNVKYARIKHIYDHHQENDWQLVPDAIKLNGNGWSDQKGQDIPWISWWHHHEEINSPAAYQLLLTLEVMLFNKNGTRGTIDTTQPISALCQMCGGNLVAFREETTSHIKILSYQYDMDTSLLNAEDDNFYTRPEYYWYMNATNKSGVIRKMANGLDVFVAQVARGEKWIRKSECTFFDQRPETWTIENVLAP